MRSMPPDDELLDELPEEEAPPDEEPPLELEELELPLELEELELLDELEPPPCTSVSTTSTTGADALPLASMARRV